MLHQMHLDCTWRGASELLPKADLMPILKVVDMGAWEGPGVPHPDLEASVWLPRG